MAGNGRVFGRRKGDDALLLALAGGLTIGQAAERAGLSERTAHRRLSDSCFRARVTELRAEMVQRALGRLAEAAAEAVDRLRALLSAESDSIKLGAARSILELGNKLREAVEMEERICRLESRFAGTKERAS